MWVDLLSVNENVSKKWRGAVQEGRRVRLFSCDADELTLKQAPNNPTTIDTAHRFDIQARRAGGRRSPKGLPGLLLSRTRRSGQRRRDHHAGGAVRSRQPPAASMSTRASVFENWV